MMSAVVLSALLIGCARPDSHVQSGTSSCPTTPLAQEPPPDSNTDRLTDTWYSDGKLWAGPVRPYHGQWYAGGMKVGWWRATKGKLNIEGHRLDAPAPPLQSLIPDGYGDQYFQATGITFPTQGCWEINASVGDTDSFRIIVLVQPASANPLPDPVSPS